jgi:hypothetical protein
MTESGFNHNTSTDSIGNISNQSGSSTSTASGSSGNTAAEQNTNMYNNLLHSQYLYDAIYQDENAYQNLSYLDSGLNGHAPIGILSGQPGSTILGMPISALGTSINQTISNTLKTKKSSIFKFQN